MSGVIFSGLTAITTISFFDDYHLADLVEDLSKVGSWVQDLLPENKFARFLIYTSAGVMVTRMVPIVLRHTSFFQYFANSIKYYHRTNNNREVIDFKRELLKELETDVHGLPLFNDKLNILELNIGGGTNASFYPSGSRLIGTDVNETSEQQLERNFLLSQDGDDDDAESGVVLLKFIHTSPAELNSVPDETISCVVCFHSLCCTRDPRRALNEIRRVLMPGGKLYFIEHTTVNQRFTSLWVTQMNFSLQMHLYGCSLKDAEWYMNDANFSELSMKRVVLSDVGSYGPSHALRPHVYGFARK